jgi:REP element-mobilizing transposase RayT
MKELPVRKQIRLEDFCYSNTGVYFITICVEGRHEMLGEVVGDGVLDVPPTQGVLDVPPFPKEAPYVRLSEYGRIADKYIAIVGSHYANIVIKKYVVMPNHLHILLRVHLANNKEDLRPINEAAWTRSRANDTIPAFVSTLKRYIHKECGFKLFQRAYHDYVVRNKSVYRRICEYIAKNPEEWQKDCYYAAKGGCLE